MMNRFRFLFTYKHWSTHTSVEVNKLEHVRVTWCLFSAHFSFRKRFIFGPVYFQWSMFIKA